MIARLLNRLLFDSFGSRNLTDVLKEAESGNLTVREMERLGQLMRVVGVVSD